MVFELLVGDGRCLRAEGQEEHVGEHDAEEGGGERRTDEMAEFGGIAAE